MPTAKSGGGKANETNPVHEKNEVIVPVPLKYHHFVDMHGNLIRSIRACGVRTDVPSLAKKPAPVKPKGNPEARIDDEKTPEIQWQVVDHYADGDEDIVEWKLRSNEEANVERAKALLDEAIKRAENATHIGFLTLPDSSAFSRLSLP